LFFKRKREDDFEKNQNLDNDNPLIFEKTKEGNLLIRYRDLPNENYDITRLTIGEVDKVVELKGTNYYVYEAEVNWYNHYDADEDKKKKDKKRKIKVLFDITMDQRKLLNEQNREFGIALITILFNKLRVTEYIKNALGEHTKDYPTGNYIGGLTKSDDKYRRHYIIELGKEYDKKYEKIRKIRKDNE